MKNIIALPTLCLALSIFPSKNIFGQTDSTFNQTLANNTSQLFIDSLGSESPLYNARAYFPFRYKIDNEGHSYFLANKLTRGRVIYEGRNYNSVDIMYNIVKDELILLYLNNYSKIVLKKEKVDEFSLLGHNFINVRNNSTSSVLPSGYYDLLHQGKISLMCKRKKAITETPRTDRIEITISESNRYYLLKDSVYIPVNTKKAILKALKQPGNVNQQYIRANKLKFRTKKEESMLSLVKFYDNNNK